MRADGVDDERLRVGLPARAVEVVLDPGHAGVVVGRVERHGRAAHAGAVAVLLAGDERGHGRGRGVLAAGAAVGDDELAPHLAVPGDGAEVAVLARGEGDLRLVPPAVRVERAREDVEVHVAVVAGRRRVERERVAHAERAAGRHAVLEHDRGGTRLGRGREGLVVGHAVVRGPREDLLRGDGGVGDGEDGRRRCRPCGGRGHAGATVRTVVAVSPATVAARNRRAPRRRRPPGLVRRSMRVHSSGVSRRSWRSGCCRTAGDGRDGDRPPPPGGATGPRPGCRGPR